MLKKLFGYDMRSLRRFGVPALFALLFLAVVGAGNMAIFITYTDQPTGSFISAATLTSSGMLIFLIYTLIMLVPVFISVMACVDFYRSTATDEGYLTFTLPVPAWKILLSKLLASFLWEAIVAVAAIFAAGMVTFVGVVPIVGWGEFILSFREIWFSIPWETFPWPLFVLALLSVLLQAVNSQILYFAAVFFGAVVANKHKVLCVIGCIFGINILYSLMSGIFNLFSFVWTVQDLYVSLVIRCVFFAGIAVLAFFLTQQMMKKKVNLP